MRFQDTDGKWREFKPSFTGNDKRELENFLSKLKVICPMRELEANIGGFDSDVACIRHDVDHSIEHAVKFARWEHERGIRASYFVLPTAYYYRDRFLLYSYMNELKEMGHEIGLHLDIVSQNIGADGKPNYQASAYHLDLVLAELRNAGFDVVGAAAHAGHVEFNDEELIRMYGAEFFGLQYEAYALQRRLNVNYISDNQGEWRAPLEIVSPKANVLLIHPCHWPFL